MAGLKVHSQPTDSSKVWFTPNFASVDMLDLFNQPEQWDSARSKIDVFKFYLAMDEPIRRWYPLYHFIYFGQTDPRPCLVDSLGELADHVAAYIHQMQIWFPSVSIGQIGLYPEVGIDQFKEWIFALEARGVSLPFLHIA